MKIASLLVVFTFGSAISAPVDEDRSRDDVVDKTEVDVTNPNGSSEQEGRILGLGHIAQGGGAIVHSFLDGLIAGSYSAGSRLNGLVGGLHGRPLPPQYYGPNLDYYAPGFNSPGFHRPGFPGTYNSKFIPKPMIRATKYWPDEANDEDFVWISDRNVEYK